LPIFTESTPQMQKERRKQKNDDSTTYGIYASKASVYLSGRNIFNSSQNVQTPTKSHRFKHIGLYGENCRPVTINGENAFLRLQTAIQLQGGKGNKYTLSKNYFYNCRAAIHLNKTDSVERFLSLEMGCNEFVKDCNTSSLPQPTFYGLIIEGNSLVNGVYHTLGLSSGYKYEQNIGIAGNEVKANVNSVRVPKNMLLYVPENFVFISNRCQYQGEGSTLHYTRYAHENVGLVKSENTVIQDDMSLSIINNNGCMDSNSLDIPNADLPIILSTKPILYQNYPNPFGQSTIIRYALPETMEMPSDLQLEVIEPISGKRLHSIAVTTMAGSLELNTEGLASGMYLYALTSQGSILATKKMVITK
jgi:hypothetical protein